MRDGKDYSGEEKKSSQVGRGLFKVPGVYVDTSPIQSLSPVQKYSRVQVKIEKSDTQSPGLRFDHGVEGAFAEALPAPLLGRNPGESLVYARVFRICLRQDLALLS